MSKERYILVEENGKFVIKSIIINRGMFGHPTEFVNWVAECDNKVDALKLLAKLE